MKLQQIRLEGAKTNLAAPRPAMMLGISLIEALISLVILSVGLLGLAGLQAQAFKFSTGSYMRTQASLFSYDIIDKMRLNPANAPAYTAGDPGGTCSATTVSVENDLNCWYRSLESNLSGSSGSITQNGNRFTVTINWWDESIRSPDTDQNQASFTFEL